MCSSTSGSEYCSVECVAQTVLHSLQLLLACSVMAEIVRGLQYPWCIDLIFRMLDSCVLWHDMLTRIVLLHKIIWYYVS